MKKVFIILSRDPRSAQIMMFLINSLLSKNYHIDLFYYESKIYLDAYGKLKFKNKNINLHPLKVGTSNKIKIFKRIFYIIKEFKKTNPSYVFSIDKKSFLTIPFLSFLFKKFKKIHIVLDFNDPKDETLKESLISKIQFLYSKYVDLFLFPSSERAKKFFELSNIKNGRFAVLSNSFPRNFKPVIGNQLDAILLKRNIKCSKIICSLGTIGNNHYHKELIQSVMTWTDDKILIIAGWPNNNTINILNNVVIENKLQKKVLILPNVTENLWLEILFKSHLGICFYKQDSISHKFMAGPSTKLNNYLLANIPFVACDNEDFQKFKSKFNVCELVDASNPEDIASKINKLFLNNTKYEMLKKNSKIAFLESLNFDEQFSKFYSDLVKL